jgi:superfamily II DNA or RNA helicase
LDKAATTAPILFTEFECLPHQIRVAEQIFQRRREHKNWLLADDIGTGKTVTSLLLMQRIAHNNRDCSISVIVPKHLISHWSEHVTRAHLEDVDILDHDDFESIVQKPQTLVVVDEAHLLISKYPRRLNQLRLETCKNVLYLTATPATRTNNSYLILLHLIDPTKFTQENESTALDNVFRLRAKVADYRNYYQADSNSDTTKELYAELSSLGVIPENAVGPHRLSLSEIVPISDYLFEHYRYSALLSGKNPQTRYFKRRIEYSCSTAKFELLNGLLNRDKQLSVDEVETYTKSFKSFRMMYKSVSGQDIAASQRQLIEHDEQSKLAALFEYLDTQFELNKEYSVVIFADEDEVCFTILDNINSNRPHLKVSTTHDESSDNQILVLDKESETGLSLTEYDEVIFYDVPFDINRIDQRIGRLDRFGRTNPTPVLIMVPTYTYEYTQYEKKNNKEISNNVKRQYPCPFLDNVLSLMHRDLGDIVGGPLTHLSSEVSKRKRFSIFDWSLNFVSHENDQLLGSIFRLVQSALSTKSFTLSHIVKSNSTRFAEHTVTVESFQKINGVSQYLTTWNREANIALQRISSVSSVDKDSISEADYYRNHQDWIRKISSFIIEWNEKCPFKDYHFIHTISKNANLAEIEQEIRRQVEVYDFD